VNTYTGSQAGKRCTFPSFKTDNFVGWLIEETLRLRKKKRRKGKEEKEKGTQAQHHTLNPACAMMI
jgi:hypothetical protein